MTTDVLADLEARGLVHLTTDRDALAAALAAGAVTAYYGCDPTADSLHVGNLIGLLILRRLQDAGHRAIGLAGGATGLVGDPSGRSDERNLLDDETLAANASAIAGQIRHIVDPEGTAGTLFVDNRDWTVDLTLIDFLRDVGRHVTVNQMVARDSVRSRLESEHGISYTEFSYMLLQARDYLHLHRTHGCDLQIGGSDQWGNIVSGVDLVRRADGDAVHALCWPLLTAADGTKLGKTSGARVWLDPARTSAYQLFQHFMQVDDADLERHLLWFTLLAVDEVAGLVAAHEVDPGARSAHRRLAMEVTSIVHGSDAAEAAAELTGWFFPPAGTKRPVLTDGALDLFRRDAPTSHIEDMTGEHPLLSDLFLDCGLIESRSEFNRHVGVALRLNDEVIPEDRPLRSGDLTDGRYAVLRRGKRQYGIATW
ncbi:tyrosine--tRNA ligase [soil metagenome]